MICPNCKSKQSSIVDSRDSEDELRSRRRKCNVCGHRWNTIEISETCYKEYLILKQCSSIEKRKTADGFKKNKKMILDGLAEVMLQIRKL